MVPEIRLLVAVPTMGSIHPLLVSRLIRWGQEFPNGQISFYFTFKVAPVDRARNQIVDYFLKREPSFTHLLMIDADTIPPKDAVSRLLSHDKHIVSALTPILRYDEKDGSWSAHDNCFTNVERDCDDKVTKTLIAERGTGLKEILRCGASCLLIKRSVFDVIAKPYFDFIENEDGTIHKRSEDINFCDKVREAGISIFADTDVTCGHYKEIML